MKVLTVIGARPQFVKAAMVSRILSATPGMIEILVHTGQHYDDAMSAIFFRELGIPVPAENLGIGGGGHGEQTGQMLIALERVMLAESPDWTLVYGDTNSTLAGSLCAAKLGIPLAHVEAGLRSFNQSMPEEINRVVADALADLLLTPTQTAVDNLQREGICLERIRMVGDVMYDAVLFFVDKARKESRILEHLNLAAKSYVLATVHRAANTDDPIRLRAIFAGLADVAERMPVVLPLHPRTRKMLEGNPDISTSRLTLIKPVGYLDMLRLESEAAVVATDSGGVQKEAFFFNVPCVTLREDTEWLELLELGWNVLANPVAGREVVRDMILAAVDRTGREGKPYGAGDAASKIVAILTQKM